MDTFSLFLLLSTSCLVLVLLVAVGRGWVIRLLPVLDDEKLHFGLLLVHCCPTVYSWESTVTINIEWKFLNFFCNNPTFKLKKLINYIFGEHLMNSPWLLVLPGIVARNHWSASLSRGIITTNHHCFYLNRDINIGARK